MGLFVLGMHRSGTSLVGGIVGLMGISSGGTSKLLPPAKDNPKGFWERKDVVEINDAILKICKASWSNIELFDINYFGKDKNKDILSKQIEIIQEMDKEDLWFLKDPRFCLTLPLWISLLENPICILVYRNPVEVAHSLKKRNDFHLSYGLALWEKYIEHSIENISNYPNCVVSFNDLIDYPQQTVQKLYDKLEKLGVKGINMPSDEAIFELIDERLYRNKYSEDDLYSLTKKQRILYNKLKENININDLKSLVFSLKPYENDTINFGKYITGKKYFSQLYVDIGQGFKEEISEKKVISEKSSYIYYELSKYEKIQSLRFDPSDEPCIIIFKQIHILNGEGESPVEFKLESNAYFSENFTYVFDKEDPQILISFPNFEIIKRISFEIEYLSIGSESILKFYKNRIQANNTISILKGELALNMKELEKELDFTNKKLIIKEEELDQKRIALSLKELLIENGITTQKIQQNIIREKALLLEQEKTIINHLTKEIEVNKILFQSKIDQFKSGQTELTKEVIFNKNAAKKYENKYFEVKENDNKKSILIQNLEKKIDDLNSKIENHQIRFDDLEVNFLEIKRDNEKKSQLLQSLNKENTGLLGTLDDMKQIATSNQHTINLQERVVTTLNEKILFLDNNIREEKDKVVNFEVMYKEQKEEKEELVEFFRNKEFILLNNLNNINLIKDNLQHKNQFLTSQLEDGRKLERILTNDNQLKTKYLKELKTSLSFRVGWGMTAPIRLPYNLLFSKMGKLEVPLLVRLFKIGLTSPMRMITGLNKTNIQILQKALKNEPPSLVIQNFRKYLSKSRSEKIDSTGFIKKNNPPKRITSDEIFNSSSTPTISIITPVYNTPINLIDECIKSVILQTYTKWELILVNDASTKIETLEYLKKAEYQDSRIKIFHHENNKGIALASNTGVEMSSGEFIAFLDHDDLLTSDALLELINEVREYPEVDVIYSDQDKVTEKGELYEQFFKPDWSLEYFRSVMYIGHFLMLRKNIAIKAGLFDAYFDGVQDFEFMLRVSEVTSRINHIPKILYHWRVTEGSIAGSHNAKGKIDELQLEAVNNHLRRMNIPGLAKMTDYPHKLRVYPLEKTKYPLISIIIPTKDSPKLLEQCLKSIYNLSTYPNFEVLLVDNNTTDREALEIMRSYPITRIPYNEKFNFSKANNIGVSYAKGEYLLFLNNDIEVVTPQWMENLLFYAEQEDIGAAGGLLTFPNQSVQHAGVVLGFRGTADHVMRNFPLDCDGYFGSLLCAREVSGVTAACLLMKKSLFEEIKGFNEHFATHYQDVDLCLKIRKNNQRLVYVPTAHLIHHESVSRGGYYDFIDRALLLDCWEDIIQAGDPYYNPNFDIHSYDKGAYGYNF